MEEKSNLYIVAIVGIVAVVALVILVTGANNKSERIEYLGSEVVEDVQIASESSTTQDAAGQVYKIPTGSSWARQVLCEANGGTYQYTTGVVGSTWVQSYYCKYH